jgi:tRNA A-37 threonylcarbamoyl transferase component Bud32
MMTPHQPSENWQEIQCGQERWWVDPAWSEQLLNKQGLRLEEWSHEGKIEIIKQSLHRTVFRVGLSDKPVYVKHYPLHDLTTKFRNRFLQAKAQREWQRTVQLQERAVPTIKPVAVGQHPQLGSYFISEEIPEAQTLDQLLQTMSLEQPGWHFTATSKLIIAEMAHFLAEMLQHGIIHDDLHAGNILIHTNADGTRQWFLIDPYCIQAKPPSDRQALLHTLTLMGQSLWPLVPMQHRLYGWVLFRRASGFRFRREEERELVQQLLKRIDRRLYSNWHQRARRCTKANRDFYELRMRRLHAWARRSVPADWLARYLYDPKQVFHSPGAQLLKQSRHGQVIKVHTDVMNITITQFRPRHWLDRWLGGWRTSPARHCYQMAYRLETAFIPIAKPLAVVEQKQHGKLQCSYYLHEYLENSQRLDTFWLSADADTRKQATLQLASMIQQLHQYRLSHRDLKATNILVREEPCGIKLYFIDFRGVSHSHWQSQRRRWKDLARLAITARYSLQASQTMMLRFLLTYLSATEREHWKKHWRAIQRLIGRKLERNRVRKREVV